MKAVVGAFNQEKALVGAFSVIVQPVVEPMEYYTALIKVLDTAAEIAKKMSHHEHADITVASFRQRWHNTHNISK